LRKVGQPKPSVKRQSAQVQDSPRSSERASWVFYVGAPAEDAYAPVAEAAVQATNKLLYDKVGGRRRAIESARELLPEWMSAMGSDSHGRTGGCT
jgi:hypothetical protein